MKKIIFLIIAVILISLYFSGNLFRIKIEQVPSEIKHKVSAEEQNLAIELFKKNNIDSTNLQIIRVSKDQNNKTHISVEQFYERMPIFTGDIIFHFEPSGQATTKFLIDGTNEIFISGTRVEHISTPVAFEGLITARGAAKITPKALRIHVNLTAERGFYDLNAGISDAKQKFVVAWKIKPKNKRYPFAYVNAENGELISYDDGIRY